MVRCKAVRKAQEEAVSLYADDWADAANAADGRFPSGYSSMFNINLKAILA